MQGLRSQLTLDKDSRIRTGWPGHACHKSLVQLEAADLLRASAELVNRMMQGNCDPGARMEFMEKIEVHWMAFSMHITCL